MVLMQIDSVVADIGVDAVKIGMIGSAETAAAVAERLRILVELHDASVAVRSVANPELLRERGVRRSGDYAMPQRRLSLPIVFDPVMVATSGAELADAETIAAFESLMDIATVVTPNLDELTRLRSAEHTSELQPLMRISYAGFCLKKKRTSQNKQ